MISLGTAEAEPGETATGRLPIGETRDGTAVGLPVAIINGVDDGSTLYLQAASDGDELNGIGVLNRLVPSVDPSSLSGTIIAVGIVNYHAFQTAQHRNPIDDTKLNRTYPGDPEGTSSERIAAVTYEAASRADLVLDLHQGSTSRMLDETRVRCGRHHDLHESCLELAKVYDSGYILDQQGPEGQLARVLCDDGIPAIDPELGGSVGWDDRSIEIGLRGVRNVLKAHDFIDGSVDPGPQTRVGGFEQYNSPTGGLVDFEVDLGTRLEPGQSIFTVTDIFGTERGTVEAESTGVLWRSRRLPQVATGEYVCSIGIDVDEY